MLPLESRFQNGTFSSVCWCPAELYLFRTPFTRLFVLVFPCRINRKGSRINFTEGLVVHFGVPPQHCQKYQCLSLFLFFFFFWQRSNEHVFRQSGQSFIQPVCSSFHSHASCTKVIPQRMLQIQPTMRRQVSACSTPDTMLRQNVFPRDVWRDVAQHRTVGDDSNVPAKRESSMKSNVCVSFL